MKLYEIKDVYLQVLNMECEDEQLIQDTLEGIEGDLEDKADNIGSLIKSLDYESKAIKEEAKNLLARAKQKEATIDRLKKYLFDTFKAIGKDKLETARNKLAIRKNPPSLILAEDFMERNNEYVEVMEQLVIDKGRLKNDLKEGKLVSGATLFQGERMDIK